MGLAAPLDLAAMTAEMIATLRQARLTRRVSRPYSRNTQHRTGPTSRWTKSELR